MRYRVESTRHGWRVMDGECLVHEFIGLAAEGRATDYAYWCERTSGAGGADKSGDD